MSFYVHFLVEDADNQDASIICFFEEYDVMSGMYAVETFFDFGIRFCGDNGCFYASLTC